MQVTLPSAKLFGRDLLPGAELLYTIPLRMKLENTFTSPWMDIADLIVSGEIQVRQTSASTSLPASQTFINAMADENLSASVRLCVDVNHTAARIILQSLPMGADNVAQRPTLSETDNQARLFCFLLILHFFDFTFIYVPFLIFPLIFLL